MIKKIILAIILIIALKFVYSNVLVPYLSTFKDKKFDTYYALKENKVESENYKITKLDMKLYEIESIQYDPITSNYIISSKTQARSLWKINKFGVLIDSLIGEEGRGRKVIAMPNETGVDFRDNHYTDWTISGDKKEKKYSQIIDYDLLSEKEFDSYLEKATSIHSTQNDSYAIIRNNDIPLYINMGQCFLFVDNKWIVIQSEKLYKNLDFFHDEELGLYYYKLNNKAFDIKKQFRLIDHKTKTVGVYSSNYGEGPAYLYYNEKPPIELQHFTKKKRSRKPLSGWGPNGSNGRYGNGWHGTGYFEWNYKSDKFHFNTDAFDDFAYYDLKIEISTVEEQQKEGLAFIYLRKGSIASALYVVSPKNNNN